MPISKQSRVLVYVQHLLGVGHLQRALQLARTLEQHDFGVALVSGGKPHTMTQSATFPVYQLAPLYSADGSFKRLLDANGKPVDDSWREARRQHLLGLFDDFKPQVLITETFPFGRRMLRSELLPLLQASRDSKDCRLVIASIRDILQPKSMPERVDETCNWFDTYYDRVIVHGDARIAGIGDSFAGAERLGDRVYYSGYLCAQAGSSPSGDTGYNEVLVSAGGSATGLAIMQAAIAAKPLSEFAHLRWRLLVSPAIAAADYARLQELADEGTCVERNRPDFSELVKRARLSISQAGYNTMTDVLNSTTASVVIPFAEAEEIEQSLRARALHQRGRVIALAQQDLNPTRLAAAMAAARDNCRPIDVDLDGAANSAAMIRQWLDATGTRP